MNHEAWLLNKMNIKLAAMVTGLVGLIFILSQGLLAFVGLTFIAIACLIIWNLRKKDDGDRTRTLATNKPKLEIF